MKDNWIVKNIDNNKADETSQLLKIDKRLIYILNSKGISSPEEIYKYLYPQLSDLHSPFLLNGIFDAINRIKISLETDEKIGIFSDSDLDGMTSLIILYNLLTKMNGSCYIRHLQDDEQYGLSRNMIDEFKSKGVTLLITVDSGIRDIEEIEYAKQCGIDVIVTDHHEQDELLPESIIINPKVDHCPYPFKDLAGVGVTFKLCLALLYSYLPIFNKYFIFIFNDNSSFGMIVIKNGIIEERINDLAKDELFPRLQNFPENSIILLYECPNIREQLKNIFQQFTIYDYLDFLSKSMGLNLANLNDASQAFSIKKSMFTDTSDYLIQIFFEMQYTSSKKIRDFISDTIGFVSIGSIADVMPLVNENRVMVKKGFNALERTKHTGLSLLLNNDKVNSKKIGWDIAPLLNTPGRFGRTSLTFDFFNENDIAKTRNIINEIKLLNQTRKDKVVEICNDIAENLPSYEETHKNCIIIKSEDIPEGIAGLIGNRISENTNKPVIVISLPGSEGIAKGSGRSSTDINFFSYIEPLSDNFERIGGHDNAFGFTIAIEKIDEVMNNLDTALIHNDKNKNSIEINLEIDPKDISRNFIESLDMLEPFGKNNTEPVFLSTAVTIKSFSSFGSNKHGKIIFNENKNITAIGWNLYEDLKKYCEGGKPVDVIYTLEMNNFMGRKDQRMIIKDLNYS